MGSKDREHGDRTFAPSSGKEMREEKSETLHQILFDERDAEDAKKILIANLESLRINRITIKREVVTTYDGQKPESILTGNVRLEIDTFQTFNIKEERENKS